MLEPLLGAGTPRAHRCATPVKGPMVYRIHHYWSSVIARRQPLFTFGKFPNPLTEFSSQFSRGCLGPCNQTAQGDD